MHITSIEVHLLEGPRQSQPHRVSYYPVPAVEHGGLRLPERPELCPTRCPAALAKFARRVV